MASNSTEAIEEALSAACGGAFSSSCLYPIEICKNRLQAMQKKQNQSEQENVKKEEEEEHPTTMISVAKDLYKSEGVPGFYKGFQYSAIQSATEKAIYFWGYTYILKTWKKLFGDVGTASSVLCGCLAEWVHLPVTLPIDAVTVRIQTVKGSKANPLQILASIIRESGIKGLYSGWTAYIVLCLKPAITYGLFDALKRWILKRNSMRGGREVKVLTALEAFLIGAIARAVATIAVFPYTRAKVIVKSSQVQPGEQAPSIAGTVSRIVKNEGFLSLYQGCTPEVTRGVLSAAIMLAVKEKIAATVRQMVRNPARSSLK
uniref:Mitochondrial carrier protein n=1 Tax=Guillardia theta TaxID=55529 RepID=A0A7S4L290_GUITH